MILDLETLKSLPIGEVFAQGVATNSPEGVYMTDENLGKKMIWVAKKGHGHNDWCIYIHWLEKGLNFVIQNGDKVTDKINIQKLVPCTDEVLDRYRK